MVAPARFRQMIVEGFRHQPQSPHEKGWIGAIADPEVMVASWFRNLFERSSFVASGKARQLHRAFGALYSALAVTSKKNGYLEVWPESHWPGFALRQADVFQSYAV